MSGSTEHRAPDAFEVTGRKPVVLNLGTARRMLALVQRIVDDVLNHQQRLSHLLPEQERLDRSRHKLDWPNRQRRYHVQEEVTAVEGHLRQATEELQGLGGVLIDAGIGQVGLPTVVNGRLAFFSWKPGETGLRYWHFPGENLRRPIPSSWKESDEISLSGKA